MSSDNSTPVLKYRVKSSVFINELMHKTTTEKWQYAFSEAKRNALEKPVDRPAA